MPLSSNCCHGNSCAHRVGATPCIHRSNTRYLTCLLFERSPCFIALCTAFDHSTNAPPCTAVISFHAQRLRALTRSFVSQAPYRSVMVQSVPAPARGFQMVVAHETSRGIGLKGDMPWKLPKDMAYFKSLTSSVKVSGKQNAVVMGRTTWESIPAKFRPLKGRMNIVISRTMAPSPPFSDESSMDVPHLVAGDFESALRIAYDAGHVEQVFVIGGASVYSQAIQHPECLALHVTQIQSSIACDTFFPEHPAAFKLWSQGQSMSSGDHHIQFKCYVRGTCTPQLPAAMNTRHDEYQYLDLIREVMDTGNVRGDRTGTGTLSLFGKTMRFNLRESFPLLTTKRTFWRGVAEELLWFVAGCTDARVLAEKGVHIWDGNGSREFLDSRGLPDREEMDLGPVYGFQWRHFGAEYGTMHDDYTGKGVDQLAAVIHKIKTDPSDRRIVLSAWNPKDLGQMALPPCHMFCQFYVANGELSCSMYQRSCDLGLGVPFNIASYALLTRMIAQVCDLKAGDFIHVLGDAHVYSNHVDALHEQLQNEPRPFPALKINPDVKDIDGFKFSDFEIVDYNPHKKIPMKMAV